MIALNITEPRTLPEDFKQLQIRLASTKEETLNSIDTREVLKDLNEKLSSALSAVESIMTDQTFHETIKDILGIVKSYDGVDVKLTKELNELIKGDIQLTYKLEKIIRQRLYSSGRQETTDLAIAATKVSSNIIAEHLNGN